MMRGLDASVRASFTPADVSLKRKRDIRVSLGVYAARNNEKQERRQTGKARDQNREIARP